MALIKSAVRGPHAAPGVPETHEARRYFISGMVQGVGFRYFAQRVAERLGVTGYVKNLRDGRVEVYAIGGHGALSLLRAELEHGPRAAVVSSVIEEEAPLDAHFTHSFSVEHDAW